MNELFGIELATLLVVLLIGLGIAAGIVGALAVRNRLLVRLGVRNLRRRLGRTALIVVGLMLATTIISAALTTGDTMAHTIRQTAIASLGESDVLVSAKGATTDLPGELGSATGTGYFDEDAAVRVEELLAPTGWVDGVTPAIVEAVAVQAPGTGQIEPSVSLFASDPARMRGFGPIESTSGGERSLADLSPGELFLNRSASKDLGVGAGAALRVFTATGPSAFRVRDVVEFDGAGTSGAAVLLPLAGAQPLMSADGQVNLVLVSGRGTGSAGVGLSDRIIDELTPLEQELGLEASPEKQDAITAADEAGAAFMSFFTTFGSFSIAAGVLLVFLIFVMLAAERRTELGIARAVGTRRGQLVQMFVFEGLGYDIAAAIVGAALGALVAYGMVLVMAAAFGAADADAGLQISYSVTLSSLVIAAAIGILLTLVVVAFSALRVSRMTISTAIRNLAEPPSSRRRRRRLLVGVATIALGLVLAVSGVSSGSGTSLMLGVSIALVGLVPVLRALGMPERLAYSASGFAIVVVLMLPWSWWESVFGELAMDFSTWIAAGLMVVVGAVWIMVYNAGALLGAAMRTIGRVRGLTPVFRLAMAYPLASRFRTGATLAMFTLVVFTLVTGTVSTGSFTEAFGKPDKFGGGFDVRAGTGSAAPITDLREAIARAPALRASDFTAVGSQSLLSVDARQLRTDRPHEEYIARGLDQPFLDHTTFEMGAVARGYDSSEDVWRAMAAQEGLAVVDGFVVPRRDSFGFAISVTDFELSGFFVDDGAFDPIPVEIREPQTGRSSTVTVIGVLSDTAPPEMAGIITSQETLASSFPDRVEPTIHYFDLVPGADAEQVARELEAAFVASGLDAESIEEVAADAVAASDLFNQLIQGFMGLGLIVGVAALGVISARSVVERRQQIGVLRAIGFRRHMVQLAFLLESAFIALTSIVVGTALGLLLAWEIVLDSRRQPSWSDLELTVPWLNLAVIFLVVLVVALAATYIPARRASRVLPAEALRYQ